MSNKTSKIIINTVTVLKGKKTAYKISLKWQGPQQSRMAEVKGDKLIIAGQTMRFTPAAAKEINALINAYQLPKNEYVTGGNIPQEIKEEYKFSHVEGDGVGLYARTVPGDGQVEWAFGQEDIVNG